MVMQLENAVTGEQATEDVSAVALAAVAVLNKLKKGQYLTIRQLAGELEYTHGTLSRYSMCPPLSDMRVCGRGTRGYWYVSEETAKQAKKEEA